MAELIVELDQDQLFGEEWLQATITVRASPIGLNARLLAAQFVGVVTFDPIRIDGTKLEELRKYPSYYNSGASGTLGGGRLIKTAVKSSEVPIYSVPPSIIAADIQLEAAKAATCTLNGFDRL